LGPCQQRSREPSRHTAGERDADFFFCPILALSPKEMRVIITVGREIALMSGRANSAAVLM
jgi:hypothetical protein